ncbi:hypothetical protein E2542_SST04549 [Spatholobus suberectus]|nr:hypothetical protein E2542_SST04549 [Spatholobus suberectus]
MLGELQYYPSGSVVDGLGAMILARCLVLNVRASLCISRSMFDTSVMSLIKGLGFTSTGYVADGEGKIQNLEVNLGELIYGLLVSEVSQRWKGRLGTGAFD